MTEPRSYLDVLPEVTRRILAASNPEKIVLFGSYARGDWGVGSDLDLVIILDSSDSGHSVTHSPCLPILPNFHYSDLPITNASEGLPRNP